MCHSTEHIKYHFNNQTRLRFLNPLCVQYFIHSYNTRYTEFEYKTSFKNNNHEQCITDGNFQTCCDGSIYITQHILLGKHYNWSQLAFSTTERYVQLELTKSIFSSNFITFHCVRTIKLRLHYSTIRLLKICLRFVTSASQGFHQGRFWNCRPILTAGISTLVCLDWVTSVSPFKYLYLALSSPLRDLANFQWKQPAKGRHSIEWFPVVPQRDWLLKQLWNFQTELKF